MIKQINNWVERLQMGFASPSQKSALQRQRAKNRFEQYLKEKLDGFFLEVEPGPVGDSEIILRTAVMKDRDVSRKVDVDRYFRSGYSTILYFLKQAENHGFNLRTAQAIMELGCGSARLIRHLRCIDGIRLVGSDVMPEFIDWCRTNVPGIDFYVNELAPPLPFAMDNTFDLIFAQSVFTHIPLEFQDAWIHELQRVLRPGGFLLATVLGRHHALQMLDGEDLSVLQKQGNLTLGAASAKASVSTQKIGSWDVFQTRSEVLKSFGAHFRVCDYLYGDLDLLVLQKLPEEGIPLGVSLNGKAETSVLSIH
jgi:SAM-dependent methyltransferase